MSPERVQRFDDLVRSERYFTATLLPALLLHNNQEGLRRFVELVDATVTKTTNREHGILGNQKAKEDPQYDFQDLELVTEFHIYRDLTFAKLSLDALERERQDAPAEVEIRERRDAPDIVIIAGPEFLVCEGKFFSDFGTIGLNEQLRSQRRQVRHLFNNRPQLRAYRHVAILPPSDQKREIDADAVLTWCDIGNLAEDVLGPTHYVTLRLRNAVGRYNNLQHSDLRNYDEKLSFDRMYEKCEERGIEISVGHVGGQTDLRKRSLAYVSGRQWKYRGKQNNGTIIEKNWIPGSIWLDIVAGLNPDLIDPQS